jgi:hypothetical protein
MNGKFNWSAFSNPIFPMATFKRTFTDTRRQVYLKTSTKRRAKIRKAGIAGIIVIFVSMLLILSRIS